MVVLGAGSSRRLGQPKQLLEFRGKPLLQTAIATANASTASQIVVAIGGAAPQVRETVEFGRATAIDNVHFTTGCSSSIVSAMEVIDDRATGFVLALGDQPGVSCAAIDALPAAAGEAPIAVTRYEDGIGHPFWFGRPVFGELGELHGDKGVWKLIESGRYDVAEVAHEGTIPLDVDTWDDYEQLLASER